MNKPISVYGSFTRPTLASVARVTRRSVAPALAVALTAAILSRVGVAEAYPFFDEVAVTGAMSSKLPASFMRSTGSPMRNGLVYLDETSVRHAMAPPFPAVWMQASVTGPTVTTTACPTLLQHSFNLLQTGTPQSLCRYHGNVVLVVNTASQCGYTDQYGGLEALYRKYRARGLVVVGFPSNDFGGQEPGTNKEIAEFCRTNFGIEFPLYEKSAVSKLSANPFYVELARSTGQSPKWNFHKYVIDRDGKPVASFASGVTPDSREITQLLEKLLAQKPSMAKG